MNEKTLNALKASIQHWRDNETAMSITSVNIGPGSCALCGLFHPTCSTGCPVYEATRHHGCVGTPYDDAENASDDWDEAFGTDGEDKARERFIAAAHAERLFLESLLPEADQ